MSQVKIPFKEEFRDSMLAGQKCFTTRTKRYGKSGDTFEVFGGTFEIKFVKKLPLAFVAQFCYRGEGFATHEEFILCWEKLHPRAGFGPEQMVYLHYFEEKKYIPTIAGRDVRSPKEDCYGYFL